MVVMLKRTLSNVEQIRQAIKSAAQNEASLWEDSEDFTREDRRKHIEKGLKNRFNKARELAYLTYHGRGYFAISTDIQNYGWGLEECLNYWNDTNQLPVLEESIEFGAGMIFIRA